MRTATSAVHKLENAMPMDVCDVTVNDGEIAEIESADFGNYVADIECADCGLNTKVYLGYNRVSARYGAALLSTVGLFNDDTTIATGYDETYFASLKYLEKGDVITVTTISGEISYKVTDAYYDSESVSLDDVGSDLALYLYFSDFSDNNGKCFYIFADKVTGEGS
ncbi:MAG: hypothetical protein LUG95_06510 [Clostridiales bacterium]|nr:hypothetical protein [Clostridiales bacterium]